MRKHLHHKQQTNIYIANCVLMCCKLGVNQLSHNYNWCDFLVLHNGEGIAKGTHPY